MLYIKSLLIIYFIYSSVYMCVCMCVCVYIYIYIFFFFFGFATQHLGS